jgi:phosphomannomutase
MGLSEYHPPASLIISPSGMRGIIGENLFPEVILHFCEAYGSWLRDKRDARAQKALAVSSALYSPTCRVLVGMDSRTTGPLIKTIAIGALQSVGIEVIDAGVCSTPVLLFGQKYLKCDGTAIISASHNPPQYNGMKCLSYTGTFLSREELDEINAYFNNRVPKRYVSWQAIQPVIEDKTLTESYFAHMKQFLDLKAFEGQRVNPLKIIVDPGAGAGVGVTARFLTDLGCDVTEINTQLIGPSQFPREFEPIKPHLGVLAYKVQDLHAAVGFAHDCDADRLGLINEKGEIYPEDIILGLIVDYMLKEEQMKSPDDRRSSVLVTNCASSLIFDDLAARYHATISYTPVGERYLAEKMNLLISNDTHHSQFIFGGEGSCGGVMLPAFNNTRDGIFAAIKIAEILIKTGKSLTELVDNLPKYISLRKKIQSPGSDALVLMKKLKTHLQSRGLSFQEIDNDVKIIGNKEWTLVHPSNTEPIIRIITEATTEQRAQILLDEMDQMLQQLR